MVVVVTDLPMLHLHTVEQAMQKKELLTQVVVEVLVYLHPIHLHRHLVSG
jgi:hypothetical protein